MNQLPQPLFQATRLASCNIAGMAAEMAERGAIRRAYKAGQLTKAQANKKLAIAGQQPLPAHYPHKW